MKRHRLAFLFTVRGRLTLVIAACALLLTLPVVAASVHLHRHYVVVSSLRELDARPPASARIVAARVKEARRLHARAASITDEAFRDVLTVAALCLIALVAGALTLPPRLLRPLRRLDALVRQAEGGNLRVSAMRTSHDEIDELTADLGRVLQELARFDELKRAKIIDLAAQRDVLLDLLPHAAAVLDREGRAVQLSQSFLLGFGASREKLVERPLLAELGWQRTGLPAALSLASAGTGQELRLELGVCPHRARLHPIAGGTFVLLTLEAL